MSQFISADLIDSWFAWQPPTNDDVKQAHEEVRAQFRLLAHRLNQLLPEGRDKTRTLNELREVMYNANACIAVAQDVYHED